MSIELEESLGMDFISDTSLGSSISKIKSYMSQGGFYNHIWLFVR